MEGFQPWIFNFLSTFHLSPCSGRQTSVLRVLLGIGWGLLFILVLFQSFLQTGLPEILFE